MFNPEAFAAPLKSPWDELQEMCPDKIVDGIRYSQFGDIKRVLNHAKRDLSMVVRSDGTRCMVCRTVDGEFAVADLMDESLSNKEIKARLDSGVNTTEIFLSDCVISNDISQLAPAIRG